MIIKTPFLCIPQKYAFVVANVHITNDTQIMENVRRKSKSIRKRKALFNLFCCHFLFL